MLQMQVNKATQKTEIHKSSFPTLPYTLKIVPAFAARSEHAPAATRMPRSSSASPKRAAGAGSRRAAAHCQLLNATSWQTADENWEDGMRVNTDWALIILGVKLLGVGGWERVMDGNKH